MIKNFLHKRLQKFYETGKGGTFIDSTQRKKVLRKLDALNSAETLDDLRTPSNRLHKTIGVWNITVAKRYGFRIFFSWKDGNVIDVDWKDPH
jgi:plasmid maintenance system killer protein